MVLRHLCRPRDPCGAEIKAGAVSINDALALSIAELGKRSYDRFSTNPTANLYVEGLKKLGENVLKYNQQYLSEEISKEISTDDLEGKYEAEPDFVNETKQVPDSPVISMARLEISGGMFFD